MNTLYSCLVAPQRYGEKPVLDIIILELIDYPVGNDLLRECTPPILP